jgi:hypothetical protein
MKLIFSQKRNDTESEDFFAALRIQYSDGVAFCGLILIQFRNISFNSLEFTFASLKMNLFKFDDDVDYPVINKLFFATFVELLFDLFI